MVQVTEVRHQRLINALIYRLWRHASVWNVSSRVLGGRIQWSNHVHEVDVAFRRVRVASAPGWTAWSCPLFLARASEEDCNPPEHLRHSIAQPRPDCDFWPFVVTLVAVALRIFRFGRFWTWWRQAHASVKTKLFKYTRDKHNYFAKYLPLKPSDFTQKVLGAVLIGKVNVSDIREMLFHHL